MEKDRLITRESCLVKQVHEMVEKKRGRAGKEEILIVNHVTDATISPNKTDIEWERDIFGWFSVITNEPDMEPETALVSYKGQDLVEKVSDSSRINLQGFWSISGKYRVNTGTLDEHDALSEYIRSNGISPKKPENPMKRFKVRQETYSKPTMRWVYFMIRTVRSLSLGI